MNPRKMIHALYVGFLRRSPQEVEIDFWTERMRSGWGPEKVTMAFFECDEFRAMRNEAQGFFVPPGHYYSPIVDAKNVSRYIQAVGNPAALNSIDLSKDLQVENWYRLLPHLQSVPFPAQVTARFRYFFENPSFSYADGSVLHAMLLTHRPRRLIEIGSGYSSACSIDTIDQYLGGNTEVTFIEPNPQLLLSLLGEERASRCEIHSCAVQDTDLQLFRSLESGDFLFIDSTHVMKTGSDVCHELFDILPVLKAGVFIHLHDIFWPFEYPLSWVLGENRSWNENYALRSFLMYNDSFQIEFFNDFFAKNFAELILKDCPHMVKNSGGSIWLRKVK